MSPNFIDAAHNQNLGRFGFLIDLLKMVTFSIIMSFTFVDIALFS